MSDVSEIGSDDRVETTSDAGIASIQDPASKPRSWRAAMADVDAMLATFESYNSAGRIRPGTCVRDRNGHPASVIGIATGAMAFVACDSCGQLTIEHVDRLEEDRRRPRKPLTYLLARAMDILMREQRADSRVLPIILCHLNGTNGKTYRDPVALAWGIVLAMRMLKLEDQARLKPFADRLVEEISATGGDIGELPASLRHFAASTNEGETLADVDAREGAETIDDVLVQFCDRLSAFLERHQKLEEAHRAPREFKPFSWAFDVNMGLDVIVIGPSVYESSPNWVDALDVVGDMVYPLHLDDLEFDGELASEEDAELLAALRSAAETGDPVAMATLARLPLLQPPSAAFARLLLYATAFRLASEMPHPGQARKLLKLLLAASRDLPRELKGRATALVPELVNPRTRKEGVAIGRAEALFVPLREALDALTWPEDAEIGSVVAGVSDELKVEQSSEQPASKARDSRGAAAHGSAHTPEPLRAPSYDHPLLALEWTLPNTKDAAERAIESTLDWLSERLGATLPRQWAAGWHEIEIGSVRLQVEAGWGLFAVRLEHPDAKLPTRTWRLEATVVRGAPGMVGLRLTVRDRFRSEVPAASVPPLVEAWMASPGLMLGNQKAGDVLKLATHADSFALRDVIADPSRDFPVLVLPVGSSFEVPREVRSMVHVVQLAASQSDSYAKRFGPVAPAGVHLHWPGSADHEVIPDAAYVRLAQRLTDRVLALRQRKDTPSFRDVCAAMRESDARMAARKEEAAAMAERHDAEDLPPPVAPLRPDRRDEQQLLELAIEDRDALARELDRTREELRQAKAKLHALQGGAGDAFDTRTASGVVEIPEDLAGLPQWAPSIAPRVAIADKALRHAMRTEHREVPKIYAILQALADHYWPMRWGEDAGARDRWMEFLQENRLRCGPIGKAAVTSHYEDEYSASFDGRTVEMTLHVQGSSTRDPLRCIRVYFHPDDTTRQIVVGHLPTHLTNRLT